MLKNLLKFAELQGIDARIYIPETESSIYRKNNGLCFRENGKIHILVDGTMGKQAMQNTFLHELGHAMFDFVDGGETFDERQKQKIGDMSMSEFFAEMFACIMLAGYTLHKNL